MAAPLITRRLTAVLCVIAKWADDVSVGSIASVEVSRHVGFTPDSGRIAVSQRTDASKRTFSRFPDQQVTTSILSRGILSHCPTE